MAELAELETDPRLLKISFIRPIGIGALSTFVTRGKGAANLDPGLIMSAVQARKPSPRTSALTRTADLTTHSSRLPQTVSVAIQHGPMLTFPSRGATFFMSEDQTRISKGER